MFNIIPRGLAPEDPTPTVSSVFFAGPTCDAGFPIDNGDGTITIPSYTVNLFDNDNYEGDVLPYLIPRNTFTPPQDQSYIVAKYAGGTPDYYLITDVEEINESDVVPITTVFKEGTKLHIIDWDGYASGLPNRLHQRFVKTRRFERESGLTLAQYDTNKFTVGDGRVWVGGNRLSILDFDSATDECELYYHSSGNWTSTAITAFNNSQYDNGTNLVSLGTNKWGVNWIYRGIETEKHCVILLGNAEYNSEAAALAATQPPLPAIVMRHMILVGRVLIKNGASSGTIQSAFDQAFVGSSVLPHNDTTSIQGGFSGNHYHYAYYATIAAAKAATGGTTGETVCYVQENKTWYRWESSDTSTANDRGVLATGDGGNTRWRAIAGRFIAQEWNDYLVDLTVLGTGAAAPAITTIPGLSPLQAYGFSGTNSTPDELSGSIEMLHDYKEGTNIYFHVHWAKNDSGAGNVKWQLQYSYGTDTNEWIALDTTFITDTTALGLGANGRPQNSFAEFPAISGANIKIGTQLRFRLFRDATDPADNYAGLALLFNLGIHYECDSVGSVQRTSKV